MSANHSQVDARSAALQTWICGREFELPSTPEKLMSLIRVQLLNAKRDKLLKNSRDQLTEELIKKEDPIEAKLYQRLTLDPQKHPPQQVIAIVGGEKHFKRTKTGLYFERDDEAWFDFSLTLHRDPTQGLKLLAYDFEIRFPDSDPLSFLRYDLNPPANRRSDGMRCHVHANTDDEGLSAPAPLLTPLEILDLFVYGLRLRRKARHPRMASPVPSGTP